MGDEKADEVAGHTPAGEQYEQKNHIQKGSYNVISDTNMLLTKALGNGVSDGIAVKHRHQQRITLEVTHGFRAAIKPHT